MKKKKRILPAVLILIVLAIGITAYFQQNNIKALFYLLFRSDDLDSMIQENDRIYDDAAKELADEGIDISDEKLQMIAGGNYSEEEIMNMILSNESSSEQQTDGKTQESEQTPETIPESGKRPQTTPEPDISVQRPEADEKQEQQIMPEKEPPKQENQDAAKPPEKTDVSNETETVHEGKPEVSVQIPESDVTVTQPDESVIPSETDKTASASSEETARCIAKLYVIKSRFTSQLTELENQIKDEYKSLPKEQRVPESRKSIAQKYLSKVISMEKECDAEVNVLLADLKSTLEAEGKDTSIIETLRKAYKEEKSLKKAYYLNVYTNGI